MENTIQTAKDIAYFAKIEEFYNELQALAERHNRFNGLEDVLHDGYNTIRWAKGLYKPLIGKSVSFHYRKGEYKDGVIDSVHEFGYSGVVMNVKCENDVVEHRVLLSDLELTSTPISMWTK